MVHENDSLIYFCELKSENCLKKCKNAKNHSNKLTLMKMPPWVLYCGYFKRALKDLRSLSYQMDHIW